MAILVDAFTFENPGLGDRQFSTAIMFDDTLYGITSTDEFLKIDQYTTSVDFDLVARPTVDTWNYPVVAPNSCIYAAPNSGTGILKWDTSTDVTSTISTGQSARGWGGTIISGTKIFFFPIGSTGNVALVLETATDTVSTIALPVSSQWYSTFIAPNGSIYAIPYGNTVLKIDPTTNAVSSFSVSSGSYILYSAITSTGNIYALDAGVKFLKFNTTSDTSSTVSAAGLDPFPGDITITPDDNIFVTQGWNAMNLAKLDTSTDTLSFLTTTSAYELMHVTYYDGFLWCINQQYADSTGDRVLKLDPSDGSILETAIAPDLTNNMIFTSPAYAASNAILYTWSSTAVLKITTEQITSSHVMNRMISGTWVPMSVYRLDTGVWVEHDLRRL